MTEIDNSLQGITPREKHHKPRIIGTITIYRDGTLSWELSYGLARYTGHSQLHFLLAAPQLMQSIDCARSMTQCEEDADCIALAPECKSCQDAIATSADGSLCATCERNLDAFNREIDAWARRTPIQPGDECPDDEHEYHDCGLCDGTGQLNNFGAQYIDDMLKSQHDHRLRRIADALPGLDLTRHRKRPPLFAPGWVEEFRAWDRKIVDLYAGR